MASRQFQFSPRSTSSVTLILIIAMAAGWVLSWIPDIGGVMRNLMSVNSGNFYPWTIITYPFVGRGSGGELIFILLMLFWLWQMGQSLESALGRTGLLIAFFTGTAFAGLTYWLAGAAFGMRFPLLGAGLPVAMLTMIWAGKFSTQPICLFGLVTMPAAAMAGLMALLTVFNYGTGSPLVGVSLIVPLGLFYLYGLGKLPLPTLAGRSVKAEKKRTNEAFNEYMDKVKEREQEREEKERLRRLFENSFKDDDKK